MSKKALAIIGLAGVIALCAGVVTYVGTQSSRGSDEIVAPTDDVTSVLETVDPEEATEAGESLIETEQGTEANERDIYGYTDMMSHAGTYRIRRVYDHTIDSEVTAREVFGKLYSYCSLSFNEDGSFELCINPTSGEVRRGTYAVYNDVISVVYDDGRGSEFTIVNEAEGEIDYIVVNYGDYDVYFGLN